jgi:hypothetical protein
MMRLILNLELKYQRKVGGVRNATIDDATKK